ncbi:PREDICTED: H/ACA ribonucleoprotein complex subunit 2-like protein [Bactrocera latifrons]|uniref:H/ACA snoRNP protein NHP2 n=2 Tax=Bactrocera TaxID=47832 RepID=A0A034WNU4_BACDO|nr:H/ACA ribonucleoprotein complex subunit 2-like protein [Bactrocera dorsalis]XP_018803218.1 PREDICTED: H/ACA ribonucleoprotein complex subunit 2-like protein [Bactrocera latifrons]XP_039964626.1 H/ACA ribonucleoprotein complex subunit 2-like protein [Bactrocera tryoni]XP_050333106.1 H/ACA ribonucleoprotein complex subunit 2-like protein [Bactrocera neohumeralis]
MVKVKSEPIDQDASVVSVANVSVKEEDSYDDKLKYVNSISQPMASRKMAKKCYKLIKKAMKHKTFLRNGLKDVQTRLRKGETGICIFAGDVTPIDIMCHLPAVCEEKGIPYAYTPSRADLGAAMGVKRGTVALLVREHQDYKDLYDELKEDFSGLNVPV